MALSTGDFGQLQSVALSSQFSSEQPLTRRPADRRSHAAAEYIANIHQAHDLLAAATSAGLGALQIFRHTVGR